MYYSKLYVVNLSLPLLIACGWPENHWVAAQQESNENQANQINSSIQMWPHISLAYNNSFRLKIASNSPQEVSCPPSNKRRSSATQSTHSLSSTITVNQKKSTSTKWAWDASISIPLRHNNHHFEHFTISLLWQIFLFLSRASFLFVLTHLVENFILPC